MGRGGNAVVSVLLGRGFGKPWCFVLGERVAGAERGGGGRLGLFSCVAMLVVWCVLVCCMCEVSEVSKVHDARHPSHCGIRYHKHSSRGGKRAGYNFPP